MHAQEYLSVPRYARAHWKVLMIHGCADTQTSEPEEAISRPRRSSVLTERWHVNTLRVAKSDLGLPVRGPVGRPLL